MPESIIDEAHRRLCQRAFDVFKGTVKPADALERERLKAHQRLCHCDLCSSIKNTDIFADHRMHGGPMIGDLDANAIVRTGYPGSDVSGDS